MNPELPFERKSGETQADAIFNRIAAIKRIEFLSGIDLVQESAEFKKLIDAELYNRWYKEYPADHKIDEEWCQRAAQVVKELNGHKKEDLSVMKDGANERVKELYKESQLKPSIPTELNKVAEPEKISLFKRIFNAFQKTK